MKGLLQKFSQFAVKRLRTSQVKVLYQNQTSAICLLDWLNPAIEMGDYSQVQLLEVLKQVKEATDNAVLTLTYQDTLLEQDSAQQLQMNKMLRQLYAEMTEGKRRAKSMLGEDASGLMPFEQRFVPAAGWENISDTEWDRMVSRALEGPSK